VPDERPEPDQRLAPAARTIWTLELAVMGAIASLIAMVAGRILRDHQDGGLQSLGTALPWIVLVGAVLNAAIVPTLRARRWRWRLDDEELDLRHGVITDIRTIVPVARIQHVDVRRSVWSQLAGTAAVVVHTAAGTTEIPALTEADAATIRDRLAGLIRTPDDD
jgi:membrane protein YdbS with pleckstrin-like domain